MGRPVFYNDGTVFKITLYGQEEVLFDFIPASKYGDSPNTASVLLKGTLYSTTLESAANPAGGIYGVTPSGQRCASQFWNRARRFHTTHRSYERAGHSLRHDVSRRRPRQRGTGVPIMP